MAGTSQAQAGLSRMTAPLAIVRSADGYDGLHKAFRARAEQLDVSRDTLNDISGLSYMQKLLAAVPIKGIGPKSLGPLLGALGVQLWIVQDDAAMARIANRLVKRVPDRAHANTTMRTQRKGKGRHLMFRNNPDLARMLRAHGILKMTPRERSDSARKAARARWAKVKATKQYVGKSRSGTSNP